MRTNKLDDKYLIHDNHRIEYYNICKNPNAVKIIKRNLKINCVLFIDDVYTNKNLIKLIKNRTNTHNSNIVSNINAYTLIKNDADILSEYFDEILQNPGMIKLIKKNKHLINLSNLEYLCANPKVKIDPEKIIKLDKECIENLLEHLYIPDNIIQDLINMDNKFGINLAKNKNHNAIIAAIYSTTGMPYYKSEQCMSNLYRNEHAINIIKDNITNKMGIDYNSLAENPGIFNINKLLYK